MSHIIKEAWLFISIDEDGDEGLVAMATPAGDALPMVATDLERVDQFMPYAKATAEAASMEIKLIHLRVREDVTTIRPRVLRGERRG